MFHYFVHRKFDCVVVLYCVKFFHEKKYMFDNYIINRTQKQHKKERNEKKKNDTEIDMRIISSSLPVCLKLFILDLSLNDLSCDVLFYLMLHQICYCLRFDKKKRFVKR